jgi:monofunctional biosynthetic peptidoglycan transglycosylase
MKALLRLALLTLMAVLALQLYFASRITMMRVINPESTAFERSEIWRMARSSNFKWQQKWVNYEKISDNLKKAVIASEDAGFIDHDGVDMAALEQAWERNAKAEQRAANRASKTAAPARAPKIVGGSTITQQLAKNLFLSGERTLLRKGQELVLTLMLEVLLSKERILEIYLNNVEWGEGVFGAEAASQRYYRKSAANLTANEAARLAVMLPRPRYFESRTGSGYLASRAGTITARMSGVEIP